MATKTETALTLLFALGIFVTIVALSAWGLMALSGAIGHAFDNSRFFISFQQSFLITLLLMFVGSFFRGSK